MYANTHVKSLHFLIFSESYMNYELRSVAIAMQKFQIQCTFFHFFNVLTIMALAISFQLSLSKKIPLLCCIYSVVGNVSALSSEKESVDLTS